MGNTERGFKITSEVIGRRTMSFDLSNRKKKIATSKKTSNETCKNTSRSIIDFSKNNRSLLFLKIYICDYLFYLKIACLYD